MNVTHGLEEGLSTLYEAILALDQQKNYNDIGELYIFLTQLRDLNATKVAEFTRILDQFPSNKRTEKVTTAAAFVYLLLADALFERSMSDQGKSLQLKTHKIPGIDLSVQSIIDKEMVSHKDYLPPSLNLKKIDSTNADELERRGHEHLALNQYEEGATLLNKSRIKKVELFGEKNYEILSIDTTLLSVYQRIGNIDKGRECFDKILGKVKNANFTKEVAKAIEFIVDYAIEIGEYTQAQELATQNLIKNSVLFGQTSQEVARAYQQLGTIYFRESNILSAETHARKAYNII
jgi:tetratricopeptide (TPR) repeat protein